LVERQTTENTIPERKGHWGALN